MEKYYKREGRRFVQVDLSQSVDNAGKYYQQDGTFVSERTKDSIGLCIISYATHHVVMYLNEINGGFTHSEALVAAKNYFSGKGELPQVNELLTALIYYKEKLGLVTWCDYRALNVSASYAARVDHDGYANTYAALATSYITALRPIVRVKQ